MLRGKFITLEGTEGVGKTTNLHFVRDWIERKGVELVVTREPGGTPLAEQIREILLAKRDEAVDPTAELMLVFAARAQHLNSCIGPALARGAWVLCDRFTDATYAYQGGGRGLDKAMIGQLENLVQGQLRPDLTLILDIDVQEGLKRARARADLDRFESEDIAFFERVRSAYRERIQLNPQAYALIDAGQSLERVQADIEKVLQSMWK